MGLSGIYQTIPVDVILSGVCAAKNLLPRSPHSRGESPGLATAEPNLTTTALRRRSPGRGSSAGRQRFDHLPCALGVGRVPVEPSTTFAFGKAIGTRVH